MFEAFTDPRLYARWMGMPNRDSRVESLDVRVGGALKVVVELPNGMHFGLRGTFIEVSPPDRLVHTFAADDDDRETTVSFDLTPGAEGETTLVLTEHGLGDRPELEEIERSWSDGLDRLERALAS